MPTGEPNMLAPVVGAHFYRLATPTGPPRVGARAFEGRAIPRNVVV
jgi:hypothetical protein